MHTAESREGNGSEAARTDWTRAEAEAMYALPFSDLIFRAQSIHRTNFDPNRVETASLLSIKTGGCPEDCGYCSQSAHYSTGLTATRLMDQADVIVTAQRAKDAGATRFCMAAAWRSPKDRDLEKVCDMVSAVKALGLETCVTLGMLSAGQAARLGEAGLDFYNHNVDTSPEFYNQIITTRTLQDRIDTLNHVRDAGIKVCCGGIISMGELVTDRLGMLLLLANMPVHPESVPINLWNEINGFHDRAGLAGRLNLTEWYFGKYLAGLGRKPSEHSPAAFQGLHARYLLLILDEAYGIPKNIWDGGSTLAANEPLSPPGTPSER